MAESSSGAAAASRPNGKIAIYLPSLNGGGAERALLKLAGGIAARGPAVDLVLSREEGPYLAEAPASVRRVGLNARRVLTGLPALVGYLRRERPAVLLAALHANLIALWAGRLAGGMTRVIISERNTSSLASGYYRRDLRLRLLPALARRFYPWADGIVAVSQGVADDLSTMARIPRERIRVIYNPVVTPDLWAKAQERPAHPWFEPGGAPVVLAAGRLTPQKDYPTLICAFAAARQSHLARLVILGEGEERPRLEGLARELGVAADVSLPGFLPNPYPCMARAAAFALSSRWEGLPGVLIEAMYCGAPLVATDCPSGPREILAGGAYGRLVAVEDIPALAAAIGDALAGKIPRPPRESWQRFEQETIVDQYLALLLEHPSRLEGGRQSA